MILILLDNNADNYETKSVTHTHVYIQLYNVAHTYKITMYIQDYNIHTYKITTYLVNMEVNDCMVNVPLLIFPGLLLFLIINPTTMQMKIIQSPNILPTTAGIITAIGAESVVELNIVFMTPIVDILTLNILVEVVKG